MSKRTLRRAAERKTRKLARVQNSINSPAASKVALVPEPPVPCGIIATPDLLNSLSESKEINLNDILSDEVEPLDFEPFFIESASVDSLKLENSQPTVSTATSAQIAANQSNAQHSTGPITPEGKATVSQNRRSHGLTGVFRMLGHERREDLDLLKQSVYEEYAPETDTEQRLADDMIQHYWLTQRAIFFQQHLMYCAEHPIDVDQKRLAVFLRYQTTHERSYYKALRELQNLKKQKTKPQIGFESQKAQIEAVEAKTRLNHARAKTLEIDAAVRQVMEVPLPGTTNIPFDVLAKACSSAIAVAAYRYQTGKEVE